MSMSLFQALERVARRFRRERLFSSLAICWMVWALVGCGMKTAWFQETAASIDEAWLLGLARGGGTGLGRSLRGLGSATGSRSALGGPPHRGQTSRAEDRAAGCGRRDWRHAFGATRLLAIRGHPGSARSPSQAEIGTKRSRPGRCAGRCWLMPPRFVSLARCARHDEPVCPLGCGRGRGRSNLRPGGAGVEVDPGNIELERGTSLLVVARFHGAVPAEASLVVESPGQPESRRAA